MNENSVVGVENIGKVISVVGEGKLTSFTQVKIVFSPRKLCNFQEVFINKKFSSNWSLYFIFH